MFYLIQFLNSVQYGLLLFLLASGLTLIFGIMGVINLAHGSFYMVGAYLAYWLAKITGSSLAGDTARLSHRPSLSVLCWKQRSSAGFTSATICTRCCSPSV